MRTAPPRRRAVLLSLGSLLALGLVGCSSASSTSEERTGSVHSPILAGKNESGHAEVVVLVRANAAFSEVEEACTAVFITNRLLLTAAHCVGELDSTPGASCDPSPTAPADSITSVIAAKRLVVYTDEIVWTGEELTGKGPLAVASVTVRDVGKPLCGNDVALVELTKPANAVVPASVEIARSVAVGDAMTVVGYGVDGTKDTGGRRRSRDAVVSVSRTARSDPPRDGQSDPAIGRIWAA